MPIDFDDGSKRPGRYGVVVALEGAGRLLDTCARHGQVWVSGAKEPLACHGLVKGDTLAVLDIDPTRMGSDSAGLRLPILLSMNRFDLRKPTFNHATPADIEAVRAVDADLPVTTKVETLLVGGQTIFAVGTRRLADGNGEQECATNAQAIFVRDEGHMRRVGELPGPPSSIAVADKAYLIVPVDCGKRLGIWTVTEALDQVGYFDNGYEYGGE